MCLLKKCISTHSVFIRITSFCTKVLYTCVCKCLPPVKLLFNGCGLCPGLSYCRHISNVKSKVSHLINQELPLVAMDPQEGRHGNEEPEDDRDRTGLGNRLWNQFLEEKNVRMLVVCLVHLWMAIICTLISLCDGYSIHEW